MPGGFSSRTIFEIKDEPHHHRKFEMHLCAFGRPYFLPDRPLLPQSHFDNVAVTIGDAKLRMEPLPMQERAVENETRLGDVSFRAASYMHRARNIGTTTYDNLLIEL